MRLHVRVRQTLVALTAGMVLGLAFYSYAVRPALISENGATMHRAATDDRPFKFEPIAQIGL